MRRLRQMVETITERLRAQDLREKSLLTWQTRTMVQFIAAFGGEKAMEAATRVSLIGDVEAISTGPEDRNSTMGLMQFGAGLARGSHG